LRPGIVHRLDKNTSGLMLVAKNDYAHNFLSKQLSSRSLSRTYIALVWGTPSFAAGTISLNIARSKQDRTKMQVVTTGGKVAITHYRVLTSYLDKKISMLECKLATGRTHQIRVHLSHKGHAIIADNTYGKASLAKYNIAWFNRQALHAKKIGFVHPKSQALMEFEIALPEDMQLLISAIS
jgi:23S rRNA pseudouridine1911/1915/1917 synthase